MVDLSNRTFGLEIEFGDVVRSDVPLPNGWGWSPNERSIVNTNARKCTPTGNLGGELNTRPLKRKLSDYRELKGVIDSCFAAKGKVMWNTGFDGHLYIGDLGLDELKKLFALGYYVSGVLSEAFDLGEWFDVEHLCPKPTYEFVKRVDSCKDLESLKNTLANSSNVGHYRFQINVMPYFKTKTLEFRIFNGTTNFRETLETINFMYSFLEYALTHEVSDFKTIDSIDKFKEVFGIKKDMPRRTNPIIFAESHLQPTRNISKGFPPSRKLITAINHHTGDEVSLINPFNFTTELALYKLCKVKMYNNSEYNFIVHQIATEGLEIEYENHFAVLNMYRDETPDTELCLFFIFSRTQKYDIKSEYGKNEWESYRGRLKESIEKIHPTAKEMVLMFKEAEYVEGTLLDALSNGDTCVYQQEYNSKNNSSVTSLKKNSNYDKEYHSKDVSYDSLHIESPLLVLSKCDFLPYHKIAKDLDITLYSTEARYEGLRTKDTRTNNISINIPEDSFKITQDTPISINEIPCSMFSQIQAKYVKKVSKFKQPVFAYVIMSGDYVLGAVGMDWGKNDDYDIFVLSDFCTNNNVRLLSKFILFTIKSVEMKRMVERKAVQSIIKGYTLVYTTQPVSMKYRGAFKKVDNIQPRSLKYEFEFGSIGTLEDAKREYLKRTKK